MVAHLDGHGPDDATSTMMSSGDHVDLHLLLCNSGCDVYTDVALSKPLVT